MSECGVFVPLLLGLRIEIGCELFTQRGVPPIRCLSIEEDVVKGPRDPSAWLTCHATVALVTLLFYTDGACVRGFLASTNKLKEKDQGPQLQLHARCVLP